MSDLGWKVFEKYVYRRDGYGGYERDELMDTYPLRKFNIWYVDYMNDAR